MLEPATSAVEGRQEPVTKGLHLFASGAHELLPQFASRSRATLAVPLECAHHPTMAEALLQVAEFDITATMARAIVDTIREPFLVLDGNLRVVAASRSFYLKFRMTPEETHGQTLYDLSAGEWNIAALRLLLDRIVPSSEVMEDFEVEQAFPRIGRRTMLLNARRVFDEGTGPPTIFCSPSRTLRSVARPNAL